ncbi:MAG TPA: O-antigen ligase family protein [Ktedonobacteraceae bacterium]|jgi:O-antigen ligase
MHTPAASGEQHPRTYQAAYATIPTLLSAAGALLALALLLLPPLPWNIRISFYLVLLLWTIVRPRVALYLMAFAVPWGSLDYLSVGGLRQNSADLLVAFLAIGWLLSWGLPRARGSAGRDREQGRVPLYLVVAMLLLVGVMSLSLTGALNLKDGLKEIAKWLELIVLVLLGTQYLRTRRQIWLLVGLLLAAAITQALAGYAQAVFNLGPASFVRSYSLRVYGTFDQPNPYAGYLNMSLAIALALLLLAGNWLTRSLAAVAASLIGGAFYLTQSRGGQVALLAALAFVLLAGFPGLRIWMRIGLLALLTFAGGLVSGALPLYLFDQVNHFLGLSGISLLDPNAQDFSTAERLAHWIAGLHMYQAHPLLGVGIGNYPDAYPAYAVTIFVNSLGQAHNYYINIAAETGTIGLAAYLFFVISLLIAGGGALSQVSQCRRRLLAARAQEPVPARRSAPVGRHARLRLLLHPARLLRSYCQEGHELAGRLSDDRALAIGLMAALITIAVHNLVDDLYDHSLTNLMAVMLVALLSLGRAAARTAEPEERLLSVSVRREDRPAYATPRQYPVR